VKRITPAIIVRVVDYGEADRVATLLTRDAGRVAALARGARRSRKRFGGALELFGSGEAVLVEKRGELWALESFDSRRGFPHLALDVAKVAHGAYACELARELSPDHAPEPRLYALLAEFLQILDGSEPRATLLRAFELQLLDAVGLAPTLDRCVGCGAALAELFDARRGGVVCRACGHGARELLPGARAFLVEAQSIALADAHALHAAAADADAARDALQSLFREHIARPLRSVEFIAKLKGAARA